MHMQSFARGWLARVRAEMASAAKIIQRRFRRDAIFRRSHAGRTSKKKRRRTVTVPLAHCSRHERGHPPLQKPKRLRRAALCLALRGEPLPRGCQRDATVAMLRWPAGALVLWRLREVAHSTALDRPGGAPPCRTARRSLYSGAAAQCCGRGSRHDSQGPPPRSSAPSAPTAATAVASSVRCA
jgi:hypothetical protein